MQTGGFRKDVLTEKRPGCLSRALYPSRYRSLNWADLT